VGSANPTRSSIELLSIVTLNGSLLSGGFSGYLTSTGITWGVLYGLFAWSIFIAMFMDYAGSEGRLKKEYGEKSFFIYDALSSIGLISGGMLGSWLKVAGIIKLP
jgi:uncharacterized membrane protein (UPF0136 family)